MTLPNFSFSQQSISPFEREQQIGSRQWYERIRTSYSLDVRNRYNFRPRDLEQLRQQGDSTLADSLEQARVGDIDWYEAIVDRNKYNLATGDDDPYDFQASHRIPLDVSFRVNRYNLSLSPNLSYNSTWHLSTVRQVATRDSTGGVDEIEERTVPGFYARHDFNSSFSASTELYGLFPVGVGSFQGLRHRLRPSLSANYQPNFNAPRWGRTRRVHFEDGTPVPNDSLSRGPRYDIVGGSFVSGSNEQRQLSLSLNNVFETKRVTTDTTGTQQSEKITLLNLDASGFSYNFAADSFRVGNSINLNARTRISPFNINLRSNFSPYALRPITTGSETTFRRVDRLMVAESPTTPVRLTRFDLSLSAQFSSDDTGRSSATSRGAGRRGRRGGSRGQAGQRRPQSARGTNRGGQSIPGARQQNTQQRSTTSSTPDLSELRIPWSLNLTFNYGINKPQKEIRDRSATLQVRFQLDLTSNWNLQGNTGVDFLQKKLSTTRIRLNRSLGCWNMSFNWVPFGEYQKYGFNLQVSSGQLSQLLQLQIPNKGGEGRLGGYGDRLQGTVQGAAGVGGPGGAGRSGSRF